jgi:hypothetical protein
MLQGPTLVMDSFGGFFPSICSLLVFLGFVQYRSNIPSLSHFFLERSNETKSTALNQRKEISFNARRRIFIYWTG